MKAILRAFASDEAAAASIEYALIASLVAVVIFSAVATIGTKLTIPYATVADGLK